MTSASRVRSVMISRRRIECPAGTDASLARDLVSTLSPSGAGACGLSGPWYVSSDDGYTGIFVIEQVIDDVSCEARLNVFSPLGESAVEACRVLRSDKVVIYCEVISTSFFWHPDVREDQGEVLRGADFGYLGN